MPTDGFPSRRELTAAYWTGRVLPPQGLIADDRQASYRTLPLGGRVDYLDLNAAESLLLQVGLVEHKQGRLQPSVALQEICALHESVAHELLLAAILEHAPPLWLLAASGGSTLRDDLVPEGAERTMSELFDDPDRREAFLLTRGRKVEADKRAALGALGELAVVAAAAAELTTLGRPELAEQVHQVSLISDELGYDVTAPRLDGSVRRFEVKTTQAASTVVTIFLSRNEAAVGLADPNWHLVICAVEEGDEVIILGWLKAADIEDRFPVNSHADGSWESARLGVDIAAITPGLPPADRGPIESSYEEPG